MTSTNTDLFAPVGRWGHLPTIADRIDATGDCWEWTGGTSPAGYGKAGTRLAHRLVYEMLVGPIPEGLTLDHLCRNRVCVNPDHLEPVTLADNVRRGYGLAGRWRNTHCKQGHPFDQVNTAYPVRSNGKVRRACRACDRAWHRKEKL